MQEDNTKQENNTKNENPELSPPFRGQGASSLLAKERLLLTKPNYLFHLMNRSINYRTGHPEVCL